MDILKSTGRLLVFFPRMKNFCWTLFSSTYPNLGFSHPSYFTFSCSACNTFAHVFSVAVWSESFLFSIIRLLCSMYLWNKQEKRKHLSSTKCIPGAIQCTFSLHNIALYLLEKQSESSLFLLDLQQPNLETGTWDQTWIASNLHNEEERNLKGKGVWWGRMRGERDWNKEAARK